MPFVRHQLGPLRLRRIPELHLREDDSAERGTRVMRILEQIEGGEGVPPANETAAAVLADAPELPAPEVPGPGAPAPELPAPGAPAPELPAPHRPAEAAVSDTPEANVEPPLPPGYRRRVDRDALRRARQRRGR
jgi:hypothetical protein